MQKGQSRTQLTYQKPNNSLNHAEQKYDSIVVAREIILGEQTKIGKWLWQFKQFKNPNYQKFTEKVHNHLKNNKFTFGRSVERFMAISCIADQENTTYFQMCSILKGFSKFWKAVETSYQSMRHLFRHIVDVYNPISSNFVKCCREIIQTRLADKQQDFKKVALELTNTFIKSSEKNGEYKAIALINEFNLFAAVSIAKVIDLLIREPNTRDILYVFVDSQGQKKLNMVKMFIDRCVSIQSKNDLAKCQRVIKELQLNPLNYPNYIRRLLQKYISYQLRAYKLFNIELVIQHDLELIHVLIGELRRQKRIREMRYFIVKYGLQKEYNLNIDQKQRQDLIQIKNVLIDCDHFGPTEVEVLQVQAESKKYLYVKDFGLKQKDIIIVNKSNLKQIKIEEEFREKKVGIDSERSGGIHVFDSCQTEILQIYTGKRVLIFDYQQVQKEPHFKQIFTFILSQCEIYGQDIQKQLAEFRKQMELPLQENIFQQILKNRVIDSAKYFKQMFPKETKCNLAYMCQVVFSKILSKYEQCSGWRNRPLRKAQLHYAALDCIVPVKLCEQLSKINKK